MSESPNETPDLLDVLDALVRDDQGAPGFSGRIAIGLRGKSRWWVVDCGDRASTAIQSKPPEHADAWLGFSEEDAAAVLGQAPRQEAPEVAFFGDEALLQRFMTRYVRKLSQVALRSGASL